MNLEKLDLKETNAFSSSFLDYIDQKDELKPFFGLNPTEESFGSQIENKEFSLEKRQVLHSSLIQQYSGMETGAKVRLNLDLLLEQNTYTVTTGHQLNIFTGPLYFIYKIVTVINACKSLKKRYPDQNFVPVYWMATEDHDFDEINHFNLFGKKYEWQSEEKGAVGRFRTEGLSEILDALPEKSELFEQAYRQGRTLGEAARYYVNELFGDEGIVVVDGDDVALKGLFKPVITDDLFNHTANELVEKSSAALGELGYKSQIYPRQINLFYLEGSVRERLVRQGEVYAVNNTDITFTSAELREMVNKYPDRFSPNVVLRPLYQETILPNLAYIGGPSELVYWLQLKSVFTHFNTAFPVLMPRNFALCIGKPLVKKINKFELQTKDLFEDEQSLRRRFVERNSDNEIDLDAEKKNLQSVYDSIQTVAESVDKSLMGFIGAELNKALKGVDNIEKRIKKSEERKHDTELNQISALKQKLFPGNGLQERYDNFLSFYINNPNFIRDLLDEFDAFDYQFHVLTEE